MAPDFSPASLTRVIVSCLLLAAALFALSHSIAGNPKAILLLDPWDGLYRTARNADRPFYGEMRIPFLSQPVDVAIDERGVPHVFATSDRDAIITLGYLVARDRLFQLDYLPRVAAGRLSEAFGSELIDTDRFLRNTGMLGSARQNTERIIEEGGREMQVATWFANGVNTYIDSLEPEDLPLEFRLLGYAPDRFSILQQVLLMQFMIFDLTFETDDEVYADILDKLGSTEFANLFPRKNYLSVPIIKDPTAPRISASNRSPSRYFSSARIQQPDNMIDRIGGFVDGKGSNNWAVSGSRSSTGYAILAGDMHLSLTLPAIWYEVHLSTPTMNTYGVTIPGAPVPVEAFNDYLAWAFTNTGSDQIDFHELALNAQGDQYLYDGDYRAFELRIDSIKVNKGEPVIDTVKYSVWGPVFETADYSYALEWVGHVANHNIEALWKMNHASDVYSFQEALRSWDAPMQNILVADISGDIALRSTGIIPIREHGVSFGMSDPGSQKTWTGRVPFDELPYTVNPRSGYLTSTNQQPATDWYPYYLGNDWRSTFRSIRIDTLLRRKNFHSVRDLMDYQRDVQSVQFDLLKPVLESVDRLSGAAEDMRQSLLAFDGNMSADSRRAIQFDTWFTTLRNLTWDEPVFGTRKPSGGTLVHYLTNVETSTWFDIVSTPSTESKKELLRESLERASVTMTNFSGAHAGNTTWGDVHQVVFRHLTRSDALRGLWRGPYPYPGFSETLSPAAGREVFHSASWRMIVDLSPSGPVGYGIYPGGQSGNPFSKRYDSSLEKYLAFEYYDLHNPKEISGLDSTSISILHLIP